MITRPVTSYAMLMQAQDKQKGYSTNLNKCKVPQKILSQSPLSKLAPKISSRIGKEI